MKITLKSFYIFVLLFLPALTFATPNSYYVTQTGAGTQDGKSLANAWSIASFNSSGNWSTTENADNIDPGDTVYFSGTISTGVQPRGGGTSGNVITLDGYEAGDCDHFNAVCKSSALLTYGIHIQDGHDYITVQDFRGTAGAPVWDDGGLAFFYINNVAEYPTSDYITVQRNHFYDTGHELFRCTIAGLYTSPPSVNGSDYLTVRYNKMVGYGQTRAGVTAAVIFNDTDDAVVEYNEFGDDGDTLFTSDNITGFHNTNNVLFQYNELYGANRQAGFFIKQDPGESGNYNMIVRFNKIHHNGIGAVNDGRGMFLGGGSSYNFFVYGNFIYSNGDHAISVADGLSDLYFWSNIVSDHPRHGIAAWYRDYVGDNQQFINNVFTRMGLSETGSGFPNFTGVALSDHTTTNIIIKNNIFYNNRPNATTYSQVFVVNAGLVGDGDLEHNTYYQPSQTPTVYYDGAYRTLTTLQGMYKLEDNFSAGEVADPGFTDPDGADNIHGTADDDYTLDGTNFGDGADLSQCWNVTVQGTVYTVCLDDALDPNGTDWTTTPPTVATVKRDTVGWSRGAYAYYIEGLEKPTEEGLEKPTDITPPAPPNPWIEGSSSN